MTDEGAGLPRPVPGWLAELIGEYLEVLADPVRLRLVVCLDLQGEAAVGALAAALGVSRYHASQQLGVLRHAGVVRRRREGKHAFYALADDTPLGLYELAHERLARQARELGRRFDRGDGS